MKDQRFALVLTGEEKAALQMLAEQERLPAAAVLRRLIWNAAQGLRDAKTNEVQHAT